MYHIVSRSLRYFLLWICLASVCPLAQHINAATDVWNSTLVYPKHGTGTKEDPILVTTAEELAFVIYYADINNEHGHNKYYRLTNDIDMKNADWGYGISAKRHRTFQSHFDGNGHKISNLTIHIPQTALQIHAGLFPQLGGDDNFESVIENLELDGIQFVHSSDSIDRHKTLILGGMVGAMYKNSRIENCVVRNMKFVCLEEENHVHPHDAQIFAGPLYAIQQEEFGSVTDSQTHVASARVIHSYGHAEPFVQNNHKHQLLTFKQFETTQGEAHIGPYNGYTWYKIDGKDGYSFRPLDVSIIPCENSNGTEYEVKCEGANRHAYSYCWTIGGDTLPSTKNRCSIVPDTKERCLSVAVYDIYTKNIVGTAALLIRTNKLDLHIAQVQSVGSNSYNIRAELKGHQVEATEGDFLYTWRDMDANNKVVGTSQTLNGAMKNHTYILEARHRVNQTYALATYQSFHQPIYVCPNAITNQDAALYTNDGTTYPQGNDTNDGTSPNKAVRTLQRAYELLKHPEDGGTLSSNLIVIMGDYTQNVFNTHTDIDQQHKNPDYFVKDKPAIITGKYGNIRGGKLQMMTQTNVIDADTRFDCLEIHGSKNPQEPEHDNMALYAQNYNLTMGYEINFTGYCNIDNARGLIATTQAPHISIFGGLFNLDDPDYEQRANTLTFYSGYYGRIIAGGRFNMLMESTGNIVGSPSHPSKTQIDLNIANAPFVNSSTYDVGLVVGGQGDGSCYAISTINVYGDTHVGRIIGGNIGFGRPAWQKTANGSKQPRPSDSFFGQTEINIYNGVISEIYGTGLGRNGHLLTPNMALMDSCATYFYGKAVINLRGGLVHQHVFAAGAGGVTGLDYSEKHHTFDQHIPYIRNNHTIDYASYAQAQGRLPHVIVDADSLINLAETNVIVNISGNAVVANNVYGGGYGYSNQLYTNHVSSQAGNLFGNSYINISGGTIHGNVYGGGRGTNNYFDNDDLQGYPLIEGTRQTAQYLSRLAQCYGKIHVNISGGEIRGMVFGGSDGTNYRPIAADNSKNAVTDMAAVYGSTYVHISGNAILHDYVFAGSNIGNIKRTQQDDGHTHLIISGGHLHNSVFGGGHGYIHPTDPNQSDYTIIEGNTYTLINGGEFVYSDLPAKYDTTRYYGIYGSGRDACLVKGNAYVTANRSLFSESFLKAIDEEYHDYDKTWNRKYALCGGGFGKETYVMGNTHVLIDVNDAPAFHPSLFPEDDTEFFAKKRIPYLSFLDVFGGGLMGTVEGSSNVVVKGRGYIRNIYGGGLFGNVGNRDMPLNGSIYTHSSETRDYTTRSTIHFLSGNAYRIFGGSLLGHIGGEAEINIGSPTDSVANRDIYTYIIYGGNDVSGTIAGSNNENYGTHINIYGGTLLNNIYGSGNGQFRQYEQPNPKLSRTLIHNLAIGRERPHVASVSIRVSGIDSNNRTTIKKDLFAGGNNTTVGLFTLDATDRQEWGMRRELLQPNTGRIRINIGNHVDIGTLVMGSNGRRLNSYIPHYTTDGKTWIRGFESDEDFAHFCRTVDISCVPQLTFNADNSFNNQYRIDDRYGNQTIFETPGEMDAEDININSFFGGGYRGSMTADSVYCYTFPPGVTIHNQIVGGCSNAHFTYKEKKGTDAGKTRHYVGGIIPYNRDVKDYHRLQLNIFCNFSPVTPVIDKGGNYSHKGAKIFGGCLDYGVILGATSINLHSNLIGQEYVSEEGYPLSKIAQEWNSECAQVYGAGKGVNTEIIGNTFVNLKGALFNGKKCIPNLLNAFGGSMLGRVVGRTTVFFDGQAPTATPYDATQNAVWGKIYGGGRMGDVVFESQLLPNKKAPSGLGSRVYVYSGRVGEVFGGARMANITGGSYVEINDRSENHFHTVIDHVYGGCDLSGTISLGKIKPATYDKALQTNALVRITETMTSDSTYTGFPLIGEVYAGGNGNYGIHDNTETYAGGYVRTRSGDSISLAGMPYPHIDNVFLDISGGTIWNVYGGANNSQVRQSSTITVKYISPDTYCHFDRSTSPECFERGLKLIEQPIVHGGFTKDNASIVFNQNIYRLFGGNNQMDMTIQPRWRLFKGNIGSVYGGCNHGDAIYYNEAADRNIHPSGQGYAGLYLPIQSHDINIDNVFGGCRMGNVQAKKVTLLPNGKKDTTAVVFNEHQYGTTIDIAAGQIQRVFGGNDVSGNIANGTHIIMSGGQINEVYGAGNGEYVYQYTPEVRQITELYDPDEKIYFYKVPALEAFGGAQANNFQKIKAIETYRPNIAKSFIEISGGIRRDMSRRMVTVSKAIYCGGNSATVIGPNGTSGNIRIDIGDHNVIHNVYLGCNGMPHIRKNYLRRMMKYNGFTDLSQKDSIGRTLLDYHMDAVMMHGLPTDFAFHRNYTDCYIGSFFMGGNHGSLTAHGTLDITFPETLVIFNKIVGGSNRADITLTNPADQMPIIHRGGILWDKEGERPRIRMNVRNQFWNREMVVSDEYRNSFYLKETEEGDETGGAKVYSGCYLSGRVEGEVLVNMESIY